jgi:hypothetical protein
MATDMKNPASELGKLSWAKRSRRLKTKKHMKALSAKGVAARAAKRSVDKTAIPNRGTNSD